MELKDKLRVPFGALRRTCEAEELNFCSSSDDVPTFDGVIGQERAVRALGFGLDMDADGYHIFVMGQNGTGKSSYTQAMVTQRAGAENPPPDWCYINNFGAEEEPLAVSLGTGRGRTFKEDMVELVKDLQVSLPKAFEDGSYEQRKNAIIEFVQDLMKRRYREVEEEATAEGFGLKHVSGRVMLFALKEGKPIQAEMYERLPEAERQRLDETGKRLTRKLDDILKEGVLHEKKARARIEELERAVAQDAAAPLVKRLKEKYAGEAALAPYFDNVLEDVVTHHRLFLAEPADEAKGEPMAKKEEGDPFLRYQVNLFVNNERCQGAPVVLESKPSYYNLFGKIEYTSHMLSVTTNFTMVKAGALHRANGGYLILQAKDVLTEPYAWETLKKALKYRKVPMENIGEQYRLVPSATMRPEPIPLDVKVILISSPQIHHLLYTYDEDFQKLFKVRVDFDVEMPRTPVNLKQYAAFVRFICQRDQLPPFSRDGLGRIIEYGSRLAGSQEKLSTRFNEVTEIIVEAAALARREGSGKVEGSHVVRAGEERRYRMNRVEEKIQESILEEKMLITTEGKVVGQINGLSVMGMGGHAFGLPSRITARTYAGNRGVMNIERETRMSGSIHTKGVLTLSGYLGGHFAQDQPLSMTAQITFEQNYGGVDGDSASSTELYAILSSLSGVPLDQGLAVTGSVNQRGEIQPIGGATEKIEGFFDICAARGLTGTQGVLVPQKNLDSLMLKESVLRAVEEGRFHIYAVRTVEEGIELLTGIPAGARDDAGQYPADSVFGKAMACLKDYRNVMQKEPGGAPQKGEEPMEEPKNPKDLP